MGNGKHSPVESQLDRLVAAGRIKEIDRERVRFIVRRIQLWPGQVTPYKFSGSVVAMGRCYAGLLVATTADLAGGGQRSVLWSQPLPWPAIFSLAL